ncbi:MAG: DUF3568 family protein [Phycisphaerales bacterium]
MFATLRIVRNHARTFAVACALLMTVVGAGCAFVAGAALGAGAVAYSRGDLTAVKTSSVEEVHDATLEALDELQYEVVESSMDLYYAEIHAETASGKDVKIEIERREDNLTEIDIRVGTLGDETTSRRILKHINDHLPDDDDGEGDDYDDFEDS